MGKVHRQAKSKLKKSACQGRFFLPFNGGKKKGVMMTGKEDMESSKRSLKKEIEEKDAEVIKAERISKTLVDLDNLGWTPKRFAMESLPEPRWLVPDLIPEGLTILVGPPKAGKSWLALNLAIALLTGGVALSKRQVNPVDVLYLALEDTPRRMKGRLDLLRAPLDARLTFILRRDWKERGKAAAERIHRYLEARPSIKAVFIDTLERVRLGYGDRNVSQYSADVAEMDLFAKLAEEGVGIIALHHDRKAISKDWVDRFSGTKGVTGTADTTLLLDRDRSNGRAELFITGRDVADSTIALEFDGEVGTWVELGEAWGVQNTQNKQAIVNALKGSITPLTPARIAEATGISRNTVKVTCVRMVDAGELERVGRGNYTIPTGQTEIK